MRSDVSIEVAEHILNRYQALHAEPVQAYKIVLCPGKFPPGKRPFRDMGQVLDDIRIANGRMVSTSSPYKLQQWLMAEALIRARWPGYHRETVPLRIVDPLDVEGMHGLDFLWKRQTRRRKRGG